MLSFRNKKQDTHGGGYDEEEGYQGGDGSKPSTITTNKLAHQADNASPSLLQVFALDVRSLALFRVMLGLMVIVDLLGRSGSMFAHYANLGVWPVVEAINNINPHSFSFHFSNGNMPFQVIIHMVTLLLAVFYLLGFKTRASNTLLWLLILSLHNRNVLVLNSGDDLLRMLLFWSIFMPVGDRFSVDSAGQTAVPQSTNRYLSFTSACFIIQIMAMYWVGFLLKTGIEWEEGTAMYYLFSIDQYTTPFGYFVLRFPSFLVLLTKLYLWFEILFPVMLIFPVSNGTTRLTACFSSILLNTFMGLCLELGLYTYSLMIAALALLPSTFWDKLLPSFSIYLAPDVNSQYWNMGGCITLYYTTSGSSFTSILSTKTLLQLANTAVCLNCPIVAADKQDKHSDNRTDQPDSDIGRYLSENRLLWVAVDGTGKRHARHRGILALLAENPFTASVVPILSKLEKVVAFIYGFFAFLHRFTWAQTAINFTSSSPASAATTYHPPRRSAGLARPKVSDVVAVILLVYILWWNIGTVNPDYQLQGDAQWPALALRIDQWWSMFTPSPMRDDGWFVIPAKLANGKEIDLFKAGGGGGPISFEKPTFVSRTFKDHRWRRYLMNLLSGAHQDKRLFYGRYLCRQWNWYGKGSKDKDYLLKTFRVVYLKEITLPNYKVKGPEPSVLWEHQC